MSKVQIKLPDDRWFRGSWSVRPKDDQMCAVIIIFDRKSLDYMIYVFLYSEYYDAFLDVFDQTERHFMCRLKELDFFWKPLGFDERMLTGWEDDDG